MYNLFTKRFTASNSVVKPPAFELIKRTYQREIASIVNYYQSRVFTVKSNHLLCRVLTSAGVPMQYELDRFVEVALTRSPYVAKYFNFTSELSAGKIHDGVFYGPGNQEIILYRDGYFSPSLAMANWKHIRAVKVLKHPVSDLGLMLPNGMANSTDKGLCTVSVNLPLLMVQYRGFVMEQNARLSTGAEGLLGVSHFVHMYVLPNMMHSHMELVILNRLTNLFYGAPMGDRLKKHPFPIVDYGDKLDGVLRLVLKQITNSKMMYFSTLKNIPSIGKEDLQDALLMPDLALTRQVWWALLVTRLDTMKFLIDVGRKNGVANNGVYVNRLKTDIKRISHENLLQTVLPEDTAYDIAQTFESIMAL